MSTDHKMKLTRLAFVDADKCKPKQCRQECRKICPVVSMGKMCIEVTASSKIASISESLCTGCGQCEKRCPFNAIKIVNLPTNLDTNKDTVHRYGQNGFKLHKLPIPRRGQTLGLVGANGTGKSTALKILSGLIRPNFGQDLVYSDKDIINRFKGSETHTYLTRLYAGGLKISYKPQYIEHNGLAGKLVDILKSRDEKGLADMLIEKLELTNIKNREFGDLSGGEMQRLCVALTCVKDADVYIFDEPSSYLDISQRLKVAEVISTLATDKTYVIVVEHDLSMLDYMSDSVSLLYGQPGFYGVVTMPFNVRDGINILLNGYIPTENMQFRKEALNFRMVVEDETLSCRNIAYPSMTKTLDSFTLKVEAGTLTTSQITVLCGRNGTGKTTFIKMLAGLDIGYTFSHKPQHINPKFKGTVRELFNLKILSSISDSLFIHEVVKPLDIDELYEHELQTLSGGELQRIALILALGKNADIYLIDEPSAHLDSEQRLNVCKVIKRFAHKGKICIVVEHDFMMASYLADKVVVFEGDPGKHCTAGKPKPVTEGMNKFLRDLNVTFRRDPESYRPRINKNGSVKDKEQKASSTYFQG